MIEESGPGSGSVPLTNGSGFGSRRPKTNRYGIYGYGSATLFWIKKILIDARMLFTRNGLGVRLV